uniref:Uncharacterized protein n=1 Tax=Romanomermis culicivorax TaxID=13658 RepID=A0A915L8B1_ROMCU
MLERFISTVLEYQNLKSFPAHRLKQIQKIEAQVLNIQSKTKASTNGTENGNGTTKSDIAFGALGSFDRDIYGGQSVRGYDTSIAANDADFEKQKAYGREA